MVDRVEESKEKFIDSFKDLKEADKIDLTVEATKFVTKHIVHHCVAAVVVIIAKNLAPATTKKEKIQLYIAARAVSGMVADKASTRISNKMDNFERYVNVEIFKRWKKEEPSKDETVEEPTVETEAPTK